MVYNFKYGDIILGFNVLVGPSSKTPDPPIFA